MFYFVAAEKPHPCNVADIVFVVDSSGSVGKENWELVKDFLKAFSSEFVISPDAMQVLP